MAFCTKCGNQMADGAVFCTKCGNQMGAGAQAQPVQQAQPQMAQQPVQQAQPQMGQPMYQQQPVYRQPVNIGASLSANKSMVKIAFAAANLLLIIAMMVPYYGGSKQCRFFNEYATVDAFGMAAISFAFLTVVSMYVLKNKMLTVCLGGFNCFITLLSVCTAHVDKYTKAGAGFIISIIALVFMVLGLIGYFMSTDDK